MLVRASFLCGDYKAKAVQPTNAKHLEVEHGRNAKWLGRIRSPPKITCLRSHFYLAFQKREGNEVCYILVASIVGVDMRNLTY